MALQEVTSSPIVVHESRYSLLWRHILAFSEMVPVLHIVGVPSTSQQKNRPMLHHTLGDGRYVDFLRVGDELKALFLIISALTDP